MDIDLEDSTSTDYKWESATYYWIGVGATEEEAAPDEDIYWEDTSYKETSVGNATHASYASEEHSLLLTGVQTLTGKEIVVSKWGEGPCVMHEIFKDYWGAAADSVFYYAEDPTNWTITHDTNIKHDIYVDSDQTLTIVHGVTISLDTDFDIEVDGVLHLKTGSSLTKLGGSNWGVLDINSTGDFDVDDGWPQTSISYSSGIIVTGDALFPNNNSNTAIKINDNTGGMTLYTDSTIGNVLFDDNSSQGIVVSGTGNHPTIS